MQQTSSETNLFHTDLMVFWYRIAILVFQINTFAAQNIALQCPREGQIDLLTLLSIIRFYKYTMVFVIVQVTGFARV